MHSVAEAEAIVADNLPSLPTEDCPLSLAHGRVLRGAIIAERELPPYDRVTMDGFALNSADLAAGCSSFEIIGTQAAGMVPLKLDAPGTCVEIATGAVLSAGADCVVPYEETSREGSKVRLLSPGAVRPGASVHRRGSDHRAGSVLVPPGARLTGREIAAAAACGAGSLRVAMMPSIAVVATGDELVEVETRTVAAHQIRRSNDHAIRAALAGAGYTRVDRFHFRDVQADIAQGMRRIVSEFDVVLITGGVSKGKYDYLPTVLAELGVNKKLHGVAQRPGKPFWFGLTGRHTPVFALPGNPVSAYTCLRRYVLPSLAKMSGESPAQPEYAVLAEDFRFTPPLTCFLPVRTESASDGRRLARPAAPNTSGDLVGLIGTHGFVELPAEASDFPAGTVVRFWPW
jgi:molybdopterin molybdotransferase